MKFIVIVLVLLISACTSQQSNQHGEVVQQLSPAELHLEKGFKELSGRNPKKAIAEFDKAIVLCEKKYSSSEQKVYASRGMTETLYYMVKAAADGEPAIVVSPICSEALYLKGYASLDLGQIEVAEQYINRAIDMAPVNSMYLSELGHLYHTKRDWEKALDVFLKAETYAKTYSPESLKSQELARAKRGVGYSLIELGKLDEAEKKFNECLELNKNDKRALQELKYIQQLLSNVPMNS